MLSLEEWWIVMEDSDLRSIGIWFCFCFYKLQGSGKAPEQTRFSQDCSTITFVTHSFIHLFIQSVRDPFPPNRQNILTPKRWMLESRNFEEKNFTTPTTCHMPGVMCQVSGVTCQVSGVTFFFWVSLRRVCYQLGLPRLVSSIIH